MKETGKVVLTKQQMETLNPIDHRSWLYGQLAIDLEPKIVVGYVKTCEPHPDSDHLSVTETEVGEGESCKSFVVLPIFAKA